MFKDNFVWGVATSAYQIEGHDADDGAGACIWDEFAKSGGVYERHDGSIACDHIHRYKEDFAMMRLLGIKAYRFSISWARIMPTGTGRVNEKAIALYRDMMQEMIKNGITPYITMYHWELPQALQDKGGWLNEDLIGYFGEYARVVAENFTDLSEYIVTFNEPQCFIGLGYLTGGHAPGLKLAPSAVFRVAHNVLRAHGTAVKQLRKYAKRPIKIGFAPTGDVPYPYTDSKEDIEAAKSLYFGCGQPIDNWTWNTSWFSDPVFLGRYPEEGLERFKDYLPEITDEDMELIHQPIDFMGQNLYNGYPIKRGKDGKPEHVENPKGSPKTAMNWLVKPQAMYWGVKFLYERYKMPIYITENGMAANDWVSEDGRVHDYNRIDYLDKYISNLQRANDEGVDIRGYFHWSFLDNFEWEKGYSDRFGMVYVDFATQKRIAKDSAYWYKEVMATNGRTLSINSTKAKGEILFTDPVFKSMLWGGNRLGTEWGYDIPTQTTGECWAVAAHQHGDCTIKEGRFAGRSLSELWTQMPELFGNSDNSLGSIFPLLVKILDTKTDLSVQVHPDNEYAFKNEDGSLGKTESWYILDAKEGAQIVVGHNAKDKAELESMIDNKQWDKLLRHITVKKGDFIQISPGTVHTINGGIQILETQQNSDITYRFYDYDRLTDGKPRELHLDKCLDVVKVPAVSLDECTIAADELVKKIEKNKLSLLFVCEYYKLWMLEVDAYAKIEQEYPFLIMSVIEGDGLINGQYIKKGDHFILPNGFGTAEFTGKLKIMASSVNV